MHPIISPVGGFSDDNGPWALDEDYYRDTALIHLAIDRKSSQKPLDGFYAAFKLAHPDVGPGTETSTSAAATHSTISATGALSDPIMDHRHFNDHEDNKDQARTPRDINEQGKFTPSVLDTDAFAFSSFTNQPSGYYTPTPGGTSIAYHNQAGDLHTPGMGFHLGTPLSLPNSDAHIHPTAPSEMHGFHPHMMDSFHFHTSNPFASQQSFTPSSFLHHDSNFEAMDMTNNDSPVQDNKLETRIRTGSNMMTYPQGTFEASMPAPPVPSQEKFRYQVTLNAPTAMIRHADEIPVTYLNKGQAYAMTINDHLASQPSIGPVKYRTVVRISFEDEEQRQRPSACWQLWKEGRGLAEAHFRGGKLQAVEYVDPNQGGEDEAKRPRVELESASFDSFAVTWSPAPGSVSADCSVAVRFNFLSTDFSHSKGVKGIPVRLCAKTEVLSAGTPDSPPGASAEVCFCKVKLFRDHGAERKLSNDVAHIKKTIDKIKQQITQVESGTNEYGKRKRSGSIASKSGNIRPSKVSKHKRAWSISSQGSSGRPAAEDDLHVKLANTYAMFASPRPASVLYLKGYEQDDPDLYPVSLPGEPQNLIKNESSSRKTSWDQRPSGETTPTNSCMISPSPSINSLHSQVKGDNGVNFQTSTFDSTLQAAAEWDDFTHLPNPHFESLNVQALTDFSGPVVKIPKGQTDSSLPEWIEALGVDPSYKPPPERLIKPVACFYILIKVPGDSPEHDYYRSVYLMARTAKELIVGIAAKCEVDPVRIIRTLRVNSKGLKIVVEDETVRELPEGQDMIVEFMNIEPGLSRKQRDSTASRLDCEDGEDTLPPQLEMRLLF